MSQMPARRAHPPRRRPATPCQAEKEARRRRARMRRLTVRGQATPQLGRSREPKDRIMKLRRQRRQVEGQGRTNKLQRWRRELRGSEPPAARRPALSEARPPMRAAMRSPGAQARRGRPMPLAYAHARASRYSIFFARALACRARQLNQPAATAAGARRRWGRKERWQGRRQKPAARVGSSAAAETTGAAEASRSEAAEAA